jgi:rare lipoprotein A
MTRKTSFIIGFILGVLLGIYLIKNYEKRILPIPTPRSSPTQTISPIPVKPRNEGAVSWYGQEYCDRYSPECVTASGEKFDESAFTCACANHIRLGTYIRFTYQGKSVVAKCSDRGSFEKKYGRVADLSKASFAKLAPLEKGILTVNYEEL